MSKKLKTVVIGFGILILLAGAMIALMYLPQDSTANSEASSSSEIEPFVLCSIPREEITKVIVTNETGSYEINRIGEDRYGISEYEGLFQLLENYSMAIYSASEVTSVNKVSENSDNAADFGLDKPKAKVSVVSKGKTIELSFGINSPDGMYTYVQVKGDNAIYATSASTVSFAFEAKEYYLDRVIIEPFNKEDPKTIPTINSFEVYREDLKKPIKVIALTDKEKEEVKNTAPAPYKMVSPIESSMATTPSEKAIFNLFGLTAKEVVMANPTEADLKKYGFTDTSPRAELSYNTNKLTLIAGKGIDSNEDNDDSTKAFDLHYVYVPQNKIIYKVDTESITWLKVTPRQLISSIAYLVYIGDLDGLDFTVKGKEYKFDLKTVKDKDDRDETTVKRDGKDVDVDNFKKLIQLAFDTPVADIYEGEPITSTPIVSMKYRLSSGKTDIVTIYKLSERMAVLAVNGVQKYTARLAYVDKLEKEIQNLINGKAVTTDW